VKSKGEEEMFSRAGRVAAVLALVLTCLGIGCSIASAAPGDVDRTFGQEGVATITGDQGSYTAPIAMAVGPDNSIYVLRVLTKCTTTCSTELLLTRLRPNGSVDGSFGAGGTSRMPGKTGEQSAAVALAPEGKVVVASAEEGRLVLRRFNSDGTADGSFGLGGIVKSSLGILVERVQVAVEGDGKIVVAADAGAAYVPSPVAVARYTQLGASDPAFNGGLPVVTTFGSGLGGFDLTGDGRTIIAGPRCCSAMGNAVHLARLDASGRFDPSFGSRGQSFVDDVTRGASAGAVLALRNGRILVVGLGTQDQRAFALKLRPDGHLDRTFGRRGIAYVEGRFSSGVSATLDGHNHLLIAGNAPTRRSGGRHVSLVRRLADGGRDLAFGGGSAVRLYSSLPAHLVAIDMQSHDRPVILVSKGECFRTCSSPQTAIVRYLGGPSRARCLRHEATIVGTRNADQLKGTPARDVIAALGGNDTVDGRGGNDLICGGGGNDRLTGGRGKDRFVPGSGHNQVRQ
jgi:uncharacterized delta-60 repeat protein